MARKNGFRKLLLCSVLALTGASTGCKDATFKVTVTQSSPLATASAGPTSSTSFTATRPGLAVFAHGVCALTSAGTIKCWGDGYGATPVPISLTTAGTILDLRGGIHSTLVCAWVQPTSGDPVIECIDPNCPQPVIVTDHTILHFSVESQRVIVHSADASGQELVVSSSCWDTYTVAPRGNYNPTLAGLSSGDVHTCATMTDGGVFCWGTTDSNMMGPNGANAPDVATQILLADGTTPISGIADTGTGGQFTCFLNPAGTVRCWGDNNYGQSGGTAPGDTSPDATTGLFEVQGLTGVAQLAGGVYFACARHTSGSVSCWGMLDPTATAQPVTITGITDAIAIRTGKSVSCARRATGDVACWGSNSVGQLTGTGPSNWTTAQPVVGL